MALMTIISFMKSEDPNSNVYTLLILRKVEGMLRKITDSISFSELELEDLLSVASQ